MTALLMTTRDRMEKSVGENVTSAIFGYLRTPCMGMHVGAAQPCPAALKYDMRRCGIVDADGGLTELGRDLSAQLRS